MFCAIHEPRLYAGVEVCQGVETDGLCVEGSDGYIAGGEFGIEEVLTRGERIDVGWFGEDDRLCVCGAGGCIGISYEVVVDACAFRRGERHGCLCAILCHFDAWLFCLGEDGDFCCHYCTWQIAVGGCKCLERCCLGEGEWLCIDSAAGGWLCAVDGVVDDGGLVG